MPDKTGSLRLARLFSLVLSHLSTPFNLIGTTRRMGARVAGRVALACFGAALLLCLAATGARAQVTCIVDNTGDSGTGTGSDASYSGDLRYCIGQINSNPVDVSGQPPASGANAILVGVTGTIAISSALPDITQSVNITGPGAGRLTISGQNKFRVLAIDSGTTVSITGVTIANGYVPDTVFPTEGAGTDNYGTMLVDRCAFLNNVASSTTDEVSAVGGAINNNGTLTVSNSTFQGNSAGGSGGRGYGGAIANRYGGSLTAINNTFTGNSASDAGGAIHNEGTLKVLNSTVSANRVGGGSMGTIGGGIYSWTGVIPYGPYTIANSIVSGNFTNGYSDDIDDATGTSDFSTANGNQGGNILGTYNGTVVGDSSALNLSMPGNYGGPTQTMIPLFGSPAICAGLASNLPSGVATDQRGWPVSPSTCPTGKVDAGAVQTHYFIVNTLADSFNSDTSSCTDGGSCSLRDALTQADTARPTDVTFAPALFVSGSPAVSTPGTIVLGTGGYDSPLPWIQGIINLMGPGARLLTLSGNHDARVAPILQVASTGSATLYGLSLSDTNGGSSGAIASFGTLAVTASVIRDNSVTGNAGGGILNWGGVLTVNASTISGNSAVGGGAIFNCGTATVVGSTIAGNTATDPGYGGGGITNYYGSTLTVIDSTLAGNTAPAGTGGAILNYPNDGTAPPTVNLANDIIAGNAGGDIANSPGGVVNATGPNLIGLPAGAPDLNHLLGSLAYSPANASVPVMMPLPDPSNQFGIPCGGSAAFLPGGITTDERGFPMNPQCQAGQIDLGAAQTNYNSNIDMRVNPAVTGQVIQPADTVEVTETNALTGVEDGVGGIPVSLSLLNPDSSPSSWLSGTTTVTTVPVQTDKGIENKAVFADLVVTAPADYILPQEFYFNVAEGTQSTTFGFWVDPATVAGLEFATPPADSVAAGAAQLPVTVQELSEHGGVVASGADSIQVMVLGPGGYSHTYGPAVATNGAFTFTPAPLTIAGTYAYTATDTTNPSVQFAQFYQSVSPLATAAGVTVTGYPSPQYAGVRATATISLVDQYGNVTTADGTATVTTSDPLATSDGTTIPQVGTPVTLSGGWGSVNIVFGTPGSQSITASVEGFPSGQQAGITIKPSPNFVVNTNADTTYGSCTPQTSPTSNAADKDGENGTCTLRAALAATSDAGAGNITFDSTVFTATNSAAANTITLTNGTLNIPGNTNITGPAAAVNGVATNLVTIDGGWDGKPGDSVGTTVFTVFPFVSSASIDHLTIRHGNAWQGGGNGGAINIIDGNLTVTNSTFADNFAGSAGGAIHNMYGMLKLSGDTFSGNSAANYGGAIRNRGMLMMVHSTFSGNSAKTGGAIYNNNEGSLSAVNSTLSGNFVTGKAGGIYNNGPFGAANTIVSGNWIGTSTTPASYDDLDDTSAATDFGPQQGNLVGNVIGYYNAPAMDQLPTQPASPGANLAPLANYGGTTQTMIPLPGSTAICAGSGPVLQEFVLYIGAQLSGDQRGNPIFNTSYPGYSSDLPCVDAGAVQTNYSMKFVQQPTAVDQAIAMSPAPTVELDESGAAFANGVASIAIPLTLTTATGTLSGGSASTSASTGIATYSGLSIDTPGAGDVLTASLVLNANLPTAPVSIAAVSASFDVNGSIAATQNVASELLTSGQAASFTPVTGAGGTAPLSYRVSPTLPAGLSINSSTGAIAGTPTAASVATSYTVTVTDADSTSASNTFSLTVNGPVKATQAIASESLTFNQAASFTPVTGAGGTAPLSYSVAPGLPAGLSLNSSTGAIAGTPTAASATTTYTITVTDANSAKATASFNLTVNKGTATVTLGNLNQTYTGSPLSATATTIPAGLAVTFTYDGSTTPPAAVGSYTVVATVNDPNYSGSATGTLAIGAPPASVPVLGTMSPAFISAGGPAFTVTLTGSGFTSSSTVYWGTSALTTQYVSTTQLAAQVPAADIASAGTGAITVRTPAPGGGTSNSMQFEVDSAASGSTTPAFTSTAATVSAGAAATYAVTLPSSATSVTATCLNLPAGATCSYSSATGAVTITTSSTTPQGTYQVTVVFSETLPGAATAGIIVPVLLLPLFFLRRKLAGRGILFTACMGLVLIAAAAFNTGCGGGGTTHQATSSGTVTLTVR